MKVFSREAAAVPVFIPSSFCMIQLDLYFRLQAVYTGAQKTKKNKARDTKPPTIHWNGKTIGDGGPWMRQCRRRIDHDCPMGSLFWVKWVKTTREVINFCFGVQVLRHLLDLHQNSWIFDARVEVETDTSKIETSSFKAVEQRAREDWSWKSLKLITNFQSYERGMFAKNWKNVVMTVK